MLYMVTFTINIPPMLAYIPYMDPMGYVNVSTCRNIIFKLASWDVAEMLKISQWL
jgi:hypothetical protein